MSPALSLALQKVAEAMAAVEIAATVDKRPQTARLLMSMRVALADAELLAEQSKA